MSKKAWWKSLSKHQKQALAAELGSTVNTLSQLFNGHRQCSTNRAREILAAAEKLKFGQKLELSDLRPDVWANDQAA